MDTNMTFRMNSDVKAQMTAICAKLGMTPSTAFNIFANAFVREQGIPFDVKVSPHSAENPSRKKMLADADQILDEFAYDYQRMAK